MPRQSSLTPVVLLLALLCTAPAMAADISWNSRIGGVNQTSAGAAELMAGDFVFELGAFKDSFVPDGTNLSQWAEKWVALDRDHYNPTNKFFSSKATLSSNALPFTPAVRPYVWGYRIGGASGEWILLTNADWFWPIAGGGPGIPLTWSVQDDGSDGGAPTTAIIGGVNTGSFEMMSAAVAEETPAVNPDAWLQQYFSAAERVNAAISGWAADADGDGQSNLSELAAGTNPRSVQSFPQAEITMIGGALPAVQLRLPRPQRAGIVHATSSSTDLTIWSQAGFTTISDTPDEIVFEYAGISSRRFFRLDFSL